MFRNHSNAPDFFLTTSGEYSGLAEPRSCYVNNRLSDGFRDDYALVEIDPPLSGQTFGLGGKDIANLLLATKIKGETLFPIKQWPSYVYVARVLDESILHAPAFVANQVELIAWGFLYPTLEDAAVAAKHF